MAKAQAVVFDAYGTLFDVHSVVVLTSLLTARAGVADSAYADVHRVDTGVLSGRGCRR